MIIYTNFNTSKTLSDWPVWRNIAPTSRVRVRVAVVNLCFSCSNSSAGAVGADSAVFRRTRDWSLSSLAWLSHLRLCHCSPVNVICSKLLKAIFDWKTHCCAYLHISVRHKVASWTSCINVYRCDLCSWLSAEQCWIAQFAITMNSNVCPHIRVLNTLMRESYAWRHRNI